MCSQKFDGNKDPILEIILDLSFGFPINNIISQDPMDPLEQVAILGNHPYLL